MEELPKEINIPADENILMDYRREYNSFLMPYILNLLITFGSLLITFIILNLIIFVPLGFNMFTVIWWTIVNFWQWAFLIIFLVIAVGVVIIPLIGYTYTRSFRYYVTNKRLIVYWKFLFIVIRETKLEKITDVTVSQSLWGRVFSYGNLDPITPGLQLKMPAQSGGSAGTASLFGSMGGDNPTVLPKNFGGIKDPFDALYKFKSIDKFGEIL